MRITCLQENLAKGLNTVSRAVGARSPLPVLSNVLIATDGGRLKLSATNLEIVITAWIGAKVEEEGAITVPARTLNDLVSALPSGQVSLSLDQSTKTLHLSSARSQANLKGIDAQEFPLVPSIDEERKLTLSASQLKRMISQVTIAAAVDDARPTLTGVLTRFGDNKVSMVATDGFRLSIRETALAENVDRPIEAIIPAKALNEVARIAGDDTETVSISFPDGRNQVIFEMDSVVLVSQLVDGSFPEYKPVIPTSSSTKSVMNTAEFTKACKMAEIFAREANHTARIKVENDESGQGIATISARSSETGDNVAQLDADVTGPEIETAFNVRYLSDVLSVMDVPQVTLELNSSNEPGLLRPLGDDDFLHVIMPMHFGS